MSGPIRTAIIGYGAAGSVFHAPFVALNPRYSLDLVVTGNPDRTAAASSRYPETPVSVNVEDAFEAGRFDLVVVATPPTSHVDLAEGAMRGGAAVVVDKPFCATRAEAEGLIETATALDVPLTVFHNRRLDGDFLTVRRLVDEGRLGDVWRFESRFERWRTHEPKAWRRETGPAHGGGILFDLGTHLIDQALQLFGPVADVHAELAARRDPGVDDDAFIALRHDSGVVSHLWMSAVTAQLGPRFRVLGSQAGYTKWGLDPQEVALKEGTRPDAPGFGTEAPEAFGRLGVGEDLTPVPTETGCYAGFYERLAAALLDGGPLPVDPADAAEVVGIIEDVHRRLQL